MSNKSGSKPAIEAAAKDGSVAVEQPRAAAKKKLSSAEIAEQIVAGTAEPGLVHYARALEDENPHTSGQAARVIEEVVQRKPELCAPYIDRLVRALMGSNARAVQAGAHALP